MNYLDIFDEIVSIAHNDYSGCIDKKGWDRPDFYRKKIEELVQNHQLNPERFKEIVDDYLLDFKDGHMFFKLVQNENQKHYDRGFRCRRFEDKLYITHAGKEERVQMGMAIVALDDIPILDLVAKHKRDLLEPIADREKWTRVLSKYHRCTIEDLDGKRFDMDLENYERETYIPEYSLIQHESRILVMKLTDFANAAAINLLIEENKALLESSKYLIIDVRVNNGGNDSSFYQLLNYLFSKEFSLTEIEKEESMQVNVTERNYHISVNTLSPFMESEQDPATHKFLKVFLRELEKHRGNGFVELDLSDAMPDIKINGSQNPEKVVILADVHCGSSGDAFVEIAKRSDKVTVIGRATAGITDYSNLRLQEWEGTFQLWFPTSRSGKIDKGQGLTGVGVLPDVYIPWTPEHIHRDIDMEVAVDFLLNETR